MDTSLATFRFRRISAVDRAVLFLFVMLAAAFAARAQFAVGAKVDRKYYVVYEPIKLNVTLRNNTGNELDFRKTKKRGGGRMTIRIIDEHGNRVRPIQPKPKDDKGKDLKPPKLFEPNPAENLVLAAGAEKAVVILVTKFYDIQRSGVYSLTVRIGHSRMRNDYRSARVRFQVVSGQTVWEKEVGVPGAKDGEIESRNYVVKFCSSTYGDIYYLTIEDDRFVHGVTRLGPRVKGIRLDCEVDAQSKLHLLVQSAPRFFHYMVFDVDGRIRQDAYYKHERTSPRLVRDNEVGRILVMGGRPARAGVDFRLRETGAEPPKEKQESKRPSKFDAPDRGWLDE